MIRLIVLVVLTAWLGCTPLIAYMATAWTASHPARLPSDDLMVLADATRERAVCGCVFWNSEADRECWQPCQKHLNRLVEALA
jgi:hypothetical protein